MINECGSMLKDRAEGNVLRMKNGDNYCRCGYIFCKNEQEAFIFKLCGHCGLIHINTELYSQAYDVFQAERDKFLAQYTV